LRKGRGRRFFHYDKADAGALHGQDKTMISPEGFISTYGYVAVAIGTFFEGETVLILAGFATHRGYLALPWVVICGFLGTFFGDQLYFHIGRARGTRILEKRPRWKAKSERVFALLQRHQLALVLGFRFVYGIRTITPFLLGMSGIPPLRFLLLNGVGAFLWAFAIGVAGYLFGHALELVLGDIKHIEFHLFLGLVVLGLGVWAAHRFIQRRKVKAPAGPKE
jgi:membrane protein DedA with SNARE-associated domain